MKTSFRMGHWLDNTIKDFPVGKRIQDWGAGCEGLGGVVVGYPVEGGFIQSQLPNHISLNDRQSTYPLVITRTIDGRYHVRSIYCQLPVKDIK